MRRWAIRRLARPWLTRGILAVLLLAAWSVRASTPPFPDWVQQAASAKMENPAGAKAVVLLRDELVTVQPDGQTRLRQREVIKILRPQGRDYAT